MLEIYLLSVAIWMNVNSCVLNMLKSKIKENGWVDESGKIAELWGLILIGAVIPFVRLLILLSFVIMSAYTKKQFYEKYKEIKDDMEE